MSDATVYEFHIIKIEFNIDIVFFINQSKELRFISDFEVEKILKDRYVVDLFVED